MKKFTTSTIMAFAGVLASGATSPQTQSIRVLSGLESAFSVSLDGPASERVKKAPLRAPESGWESIGEGTWIEDFFTPFGDVAEGSNWTVEIEKSGDWYRCLPYATGAVSDNLNKYDTETYFYVNATDPDKVYFETAWFWGGDFGVSCLVPENGWEGDDYNKYGTLKDNVIHFPQGSSAINFIERWFGSCPNDGTYIVLPGGEMPGVHDYSFSMSVPMCPDAGNNYAIEVTCGADIPQYALAMVSKMPAMTENNLQYVAEHGSKFDRATTTIPFTAEAADTKPGLKYVIAVPLDESGKVVGGALDFFIVSYDNADEWKDAGTVTFTDPFVAPFYELGDVEPYEVACQEHVSRPGYFRLVNPYQGHPLIGKATDQWEKYDLAHGHDHYIHIDASDPKFVKVEPSAIGIGADYGDMFVGDMLSYYIDLGNSLDKLMEAGYEPATYEDGLITFPAKSLYVGEKRYVDGSPQTCGATVLDFSKVTGASAPWADAEDSEAEYYNLQGLRVSAPGAGLHIRRQGTRVSKVMLP